MHFVSAFAGGQLMADPRLKSPDRWVGAVCRGMRLTFFLYNKTEADEINESELQIMLREFSVFN